MPDNSKSIDGADHEPPKRLFQKEFAKKMRHEAYLRAKEHRRTDPRQLAMKEKLKQQRRDAYQKAKERGKIIRAERKKAAEKKAAEDGATEGQALLSTLMRASALKPAVKHTSLHIKEDGRK
jgi:hypothetical protein